MRYKLDDIIKEENNYIDYCINFITLYNELKVGDKIWHVLSKKIIESEFFGFSKCEWQSLDSSTYSCQTCKGRLHVKNDDIERNLCVGHTRSRNSHVYKIIKNDMLLEDDLFEI